MKTFLINSLFGICFTLVFVVAPKAGSATVVTDTIKVTSMQCGMCETRIEKALKKSDFISEIKADVNTESVIVTYDNASAKKEDIERLISKVGYDTVNLKADKGAQDNLHGCCRPGSHKK